MVVTPLTADELVGALDGLGVHFLTGGEVNPRAQSLGQDELLAGLAAQPDARLRLAIIPLLLRRPEFAAAAYEAAERVSGTAQHTLKLYYTAAVLLQQRHRDRLVQLLGPQSSLPDLFGRELGVPRAGDSLERLQQLGNRHAELTGLRINWIGTYEHAVQRLIKRLELEALWVNPPAV